MSIRTKLLLFLLPPIIVCTLFISSVLSYNWYKEIREGIETRLKSAVISGLSVIDPKHLQENPNPFFSFKKIYHEEALFERFSEVQKRLDIDHLYLIHFTPSNDSVSLPFSLDSENPSFLFQKISFEHKKNSVIFLHCSLEKDQLFPMTKQIHFTPFYSITPQGEKLLTAYAPIFNEKLQPMGVIAADVSVTFLHKKLQEGISMIALSALLTILLATLFLFLVSNKIVEPVEKLNNSALFIASGQYGEKITVKGPKEIVELSNTLSTMSECLYENINRLKENSLLRERLYGEHECAMLLQNHMLQKVIDECQSDAIAVKAIPLFSSEPRGLLLDMPILSPNLVSIHLVEAKEKGFEGMYQLLTNYKLFKEERKKTLGKDASFLHLSLDLTKKQMDWKASRFFPPIIWSLKQKELIRPVQANISLEPGDFFFVCSQGLVHFFREEKKIEDLLVKVLKFFAEDGLETCVSMLQKELNFTIKKKELKEDIHLLCFQLLY